MRDHPFSRKEGEKTHFPATTLEGLRNPTNYTRSIWQQIFTRFRHVSFFLPRRNSGAAMWNWFSVCVCVCFAQGPPLYSFTYVSKYSCPSTRLKYNSTLTLLTLRRTRTHSFWKMTSKRKDTVCPLLRSRKWRTWITIPQRSLMYQVLKWSVTAFFVLCTVYKENKSPYK